MLHLNLLFCKLVLHLTINNKASVRGDDNYIQSLRITIFTTTLTILCTRSDVIMIWTMIMQNLGKHWSYLTHRNQSNFCWVIKSKVIVDSVSEILKCQHKPHHTIDSLKSTTSLCKTLLDNFNLKTKGMHCQRSRLVRSILY